MIVRDTHLRAALHGIEPGWYRAAELLPRFNEWAKQAGKEQITAKTLGEAIARELTSTRRGASGGSKWWMDQAVLEHRAWFRGDTDVSTGQPT